MLHKLWTRLTGWHARQSQDNELFRFWFYTKEDGPQFSIEIPRKLYLKFGAEISFGGHDHDVMLQFACGVWGFLSADRLIPKQWRQRFFEILQGAANDRIYDRSLGLMLRYDPDMETVFLDVDLWRNSHCYSSDDKHKLPWAGNGWGKLIDLADLVLGKKQHLSWKHHPELVTKRAVWVCLPEGRYPAKLTVTRERWVRSLWLAVEKRWPDLAPEPLYWPHLEIPGGIPEPGKGENSWDCGDDAIYASSQPATIEHPVAHLVADKVAESVMRHRRNYGGGYSYAPSEGWPPHMVPYSEHSPKFPESFEQEGFESW
jgi:hypothetical protein